VLTVSSSQAAAGKPEVVCRRSARTPAGSVVRRQRAALRRTRRSLCKHQARCHLPSKVEYVDIMPDYSVYSAGR